MMNAQTKTGLVTDVAGTVGGNATTHHGFDSKLSSDPRTDLVRGTAVRFTRKGGWVYGKVVARHLNPDRKPGLGRVAYDVDFHPGY